MADFGNVETMLAGVLDTNLRKILKAIHEYELKDLRFGRASDGDPSKNFGGGFFRLTTPAVANTEFSILHTFGRKPYLLIPVLPLDQIGAKIVRLEVTRAADASRVHLRSPETSAAVFVYLEG
jgi:hypothetical protein